MQELRKRIEHIHLKNLDSMMLLNLAVKDPNFFYFANSNADGIFFLDFMKKPLIFASEMEYARQKKSWVKNVIKTEKFEDISKFLNGRIGINKKGMTASAYEKLKKIGRQNNVKFVDISEQLENARMIKTQYEIQCIKRACNITKKVLEKTQSEINTKITEIELKGLIELLIHKLGAEPAFPPIVASGKNTAIPHHEPGNAKLNGAILIDFGVRYRGYVSDITRTIGSKYENLIENVLTSIENKIMPGIKAKKIDLLSRKLLGKHSKHFITSLGHGIGIDVHEKPYISRSSEDIFKENMVFTLEPGIYVKNGIRIENDYLLAKKGLLNLTDF